MHSRIVGKFRMEGCGHDFSLAHGDGILIALGREDFYSFSDAFNFRCANENHLGGRTGEGAFTNGAVDLSSIGVAANADVQGAESGLPGIFYFTGQQDGAGAGAEGWLHAHELFELFESSFSEQLEEGAGFAPGNHESVDFVELLGLFYEHDFSPQLLEPAAVRIEISLQGEDTDFHKTTTTEGTKDHRGCTARLPV